MSDDIKFRIESAKWILERNIAWIATADVKVGVVVAIDTAMLAGLAATFAASSMAARTPWAYTALSATTAATLIGIFCAAMAAIPRTSGPLQSNIFFGGIAPKGSAQYSSELAQLDETALLKDLGSQIHRNAEIACDKHAWLKKALCWSFFAAIPWVAAIVFLLRA